MTDKENKLRVASYNILHGGEKRLNKIFKVIEEIDPDICSLQELVGSSERIRLIKNKASRLNYYFYIAFANSKYNIAVLSKHPLKVKTIKKGFRHVAVNARVKSGLFSELEFYFVHLSPVSEDLRIAEIERFKKQVGLSKKTILMGDFNSLSWRDPYNKDRLLKTFQKFGIKKYGIERLRFDVIKKIESMGFVDGAYYLKSKFKPTTPTISNKDINHIAKIRIDYAFFSKDISNLVNKYKVVKSGVVEAASDHYPIIIELQK